MYASGGEVGVTTVHQSIAVNIAGRAGKGDPVGIAMGGPVGVESGEAGNYLDRYRPAGGDLCDIGGICCSAEINAPRCIVVGVDRIGNQVAIGIGIGPAGCVIAYDGGGRIGALVCALCRESAVNRVGEAVTIGIPVEDIGDAVAVGIGRPVNAVDCTVFVIVEVV